MTATARISHRWYVLASFGSFVAEAEGGTLLVAPMNADGTRSTYEGEIIALGDDARAEDPQHEAICRQTVQAGKLADAFRSILRSWLTEAQLLEIDARNAAEPAGSEVCHSHDFCDSNMAMLDAFPRALGRDMRLESGPEGDEDSDLFNLAWSLAKADGFSTYRPTAEDFALLLGIAAGSDLGIADEADAVRLRLLVDRLRTIVEPQPFDPSTDGDRPK